MADEDGVLRTVSAVSTTASDAAAAVVSESLEGLVSAVDELKKSMGLGEQVDFAAVEAFVLKLRLENQEFRQFAEEAIVSAQRLKEERDALQGRLDQAALEATMGAALAETQKLRDVADDFERDLHAKQLAEAEARAGEAAALRERVAELEEENAGLTATLNEFRATTHQLQRLQSHEVRRLQAVEASGARGAAVAAAGATAVALAAVPETAPAANGAPHLGSGSGGSSPGAASSGGAADGSPAAPRSPAASPRVAALAPAAPAPSAQGVAAVAIAEQLEEVAGGANSGLLAEAAAALRVLSERDAALGATQAENARLRAEVEELNDTMFSKTFKPPSAWAEREIKYKRELKEWEERQKESAARVAALTAEAAAFSGAARATELEGRVQELEAKVVETRRERDAARAQLHELQLSLRTEGEFGAGGRRLSPYKGPAGVAVGEGHEVAQLVTNLESGGVGMEPPEAAGVAAAAGRLHGLQAQLAAAASENRHLRGQLAGQQVVAVPASLHSELGQVATAAAVVAAAGELEARLAAAEAEGAALRRQLQQGAPAAGQLHPEGGADAAAAAAEQRAAALEEEASAAGEGEGAAALLQRAAALRQLGARLRAAEDETTALRGQLADLEPVVLRIGAAEGAGEAGAAGEQAVEVPAALRGELGASAAAAAAAAKAAALQGELGERQREAGDLQQTIRLALAAEEAAAAAAAMADRVQLSLDVREEQAAAGDGAAAQEAAQEAAALRQQLAAAQRQKEAAQAQVWQLAELAEGMQKAEAERRRLAAALAAAAPVALSLSLSGGGGEPAAGEGEEAARLRAELAAAQAHSEGLRERLAALEAAAPVSLSLRVAGEEAPAPAPEPAPVVLALNVRDGEAAAPQPAPEPAAPVALSLRLEAGGDEAAQARLAAAEAEAARLRAQLAELRPVALQLSLGTGGDASPPRSAPAFSPSASPEMALAREPSSVSLHSLGQYSAEAAGALSAERAAADAAWREHQKATDVPSLLRARAELETRCQMLEAQLGKMQGELEHADEAAAVMETQLDSVLESGDVSKLGELKEQLAAAPGRPSLGRRMFKRAGGKASPSKDSLKATVHEMQDALTASEAERNALKRQLAKLSKRYQQVAQQQAHAAGVIACASALHEVEAEADCADLSLPAGRDADGELELLKMREENSMLMEHVVMVKVRQAEMEGEYLEAKRQLIRAREKNVQLARKLSEVREAAERGEALPLTPRGGAHAPADAGAGRAGAGVQPGVGSAEQPMRKGLRIPGL